METVSVLELQPDYRTCRFHNRPAVFAVVGRTVHVACTVAGCEREAWTGHRMVSGAGYVPTRQYRITDAAGHVFRAYGAGSRCERCALVPVHPGDETEPCSKDG